MSSTKNTSRDPRLTLKTEDFTFSIDADVRTTEFRSPEGIPEKLRQRHRLRVLRGTDVLGVLVEPARWSEMEAAAAMLVQQIADLNERLEEEAALRIIAERSHKAEWIRGNPEVAKSIAEDIADL
jgi:hypothetical protein